MRILLKFYSNDFPEIGHFQNFYQFSFFEDLVEIDQFFTTSNWNKILKFRTNIRQAPKSARNRRGVTAAVRTVADTAHRAVVAIVRQREDALDHVSDPVRGNIVDERPFGIPLVRLWGINLEKNSQNLVDVG